MMKEWLKQELYKLSKILNTFLYQLSIQGWK